MPDKDSESAKFYHEVRESYYRLKTIEESRNLRRRDLEKPFEDSYWGFIFIFFIRRMKPYEMKILQTEFERAGFPRFENEAATMIGDGGIRSAICHALRVLPKADIVTEDVFLKVMTQTL